MQAIEKYLAAQRLEEMDRWNKTHLYTSSIMTNTLFRVIVSIKKKGLLVRKGKAMLQLHTDSLTRINRLDIFLDMIMTVADRAERFDITYLIRAGSSGYLKPGAVLGTLESTD